MRTCFTVKIYRIASTYAMTFGMVDEFSAFNDGFLSLYCCDLQETFQVLISLRSGFS